MKLEINKYLSIEISEPNELIELMSDNEKVELIESLSCHESVIKHVAAQLIYGCTENGYNGSIGYSETPHTAVQVATHQLIENVNSLAYKEIARLERMVKSERERTACWVHKFHSKKF